MESPISFKVLFVETIWWMPLRLSSHSCKAWMLMLVVLRKLMIFILIMYWCDNAIYCSSQHTHFTKKRTSRRINVLYSQLWRDSIITLLVLICVFWAIWSVNIWCCLWSQFKILESPPWRLVDMNILKVQQRFGKITLKSIKTFQSWANWWASMKIQNEKCLFWGNRFMSKLWFLETQNFWGKFKVKLTFPNILPALWQIMHNFFVKSSLADMGNHNNVKRRTLINASPNFVSHLASLSRPSIYNLQMNVLKVFY